jgi:hypothetical protein
MSGSTPAASLKRKAGESVTRFDVSVLSRGKTVAAAVSLWQWRRNATLDRQIAVNSREPLVIVAVHSSGNLERYT